MFIDRVRTNLNALINTDGRGNVTPDEFNSMLYLVVLEKFEEYWSELNKSVNREGRGMINAGLENIPDRIRERMQYFLTQDGLDKAGEIYKLPGDCRYIDALLYKDVEIEFSKTASEFYQIKRTADITPTETYPICLRTFDTVLVLPPSIVSPLTIYYLRNPKVPKWTYTEFQNAELFNPSASDFQDIDMHISEEDDIINRMLMKFGINLKEPEVQDAAQSMEAMDANQQNVT